MRRGLATALVAVLVAGAGAAGSLATSRGPQPPAVYVVRPGDTLGGIAARFGTSQNAVILANGIKDPNHIVVGQKLAIPTGSAGVGGDGGLPAKLLAHPERLALRPHFEWWAAYYRVPPDLLEALGWVESGWQRNVVSRAGAVGIGQLMPDTVAFMWKLIGVPLDPFRADDNIRMTARFVRYLYDATGGPVTSVLGSYYQGLRSFRAGPVRAETLIYVATVLAVRPSFR